MSRVLIISLKIRTIISVKIQYPHAKPNITESIKLKFGIILANMRYDDNINIVIKIISINIFKYRLIFLRD